MKQMQFFVFVRKEFLHIFRDRRTMLLLLGMPIVQILLFGFAITTEVKNVRLGVVAPRNDVTTRTIVERLDASEYFAVTRLFSDPQGAEKAFRKNEIDMACVVNSDAAPPGQSGESKLMLIADATDPNMAVSRVSYAEGIISEVERDMLEGKRPGGSIIPHLKLLYNPQMKSAYNFVPGVMGLILMLICAMMTSVSIVREKEQGTMEVLLVSPMNPLLIILSKSIPYLVLSLVNLCTILLLSVFVLHVPVAGSLFTLSLLSFVFIFVSLSLGLLVSTLTRTQVAAMLVSAIVLMMPTMLLSGMIFPVESMPALLQVMASLLPARWFIQAVRKVMIEGLPIEMILKELAILIGMATVLITLSLKKFKKRLE